MKQGQLNCRVKTDCMSAADAGVNCCKSVMTCSLTRGQSKVHSVSIWVYVEWIKTAELFTASCLCKRQRSIDVGSKVHLTVLYNEVLWRVCVFKPLVA
jgi:hypothetical protein